MMESGQITLGELLARRRPLELAELRPGRMVWIEERDRGAGRFLLTPATLQSTEWNDAHGCIRYAFERYVAGWPPSRYCRMATFYGQEWRVWDVEPTPEEREETPWRERE